MSSLVARLEGWTGSEAVKVFWPCLAFFSDDAHAQTHKTDVRTHTKTDKHPTHSTHTLQHTTTDAQIVNMGRATRLRIAIIEPGFAWAGS